MLETHELIIAGRYRLARHLRRGGMSEVFLAIDEQTQQQVALKLVSNDKPDCFKRLKREVRMLGKLSHEHILPILDCGEWEDCAYLVMPYKEHGNLRDHLVRGPLNQQEAGIILAQIGSALQCVHEHGIVHRDIKATNILLDKAEEMIFYLADFGLAKVPSECSDITLAGYLIGTPEYMAPELVTQPESVSSDIYALGILLYQMLTGQLPFTGVSSIAVCMKHLHELPLPPSSLNPAISPEVEAVILCAIDKDPARRFPDAQSMVKAYEQALLLSQQASPPILSHALPPAMVTIYKLVQRPTTSIDFKQQGRFPRISSIKGRAFLALIVLLAVFCTTSLGFVVGYRGSPPATIASVSVHNIAKAIQLVQPVQPVQPAQPAQPARVNPPKRPASPKPSSPAARNPQPSPPPAPHHKHHKHGHGKGDGGDGGGGDD